MLCHLLVVSRWDAVPVGVVETMAKEVRCQVESIVEVAEQEFGSGCLLSSGEEVVTMGMTEEDGADDRGRLDVPGAFLEDAAVTNESRTSDGGQQQQRGATTTRDYGFAPPPPPGARSREAVEAFQSKTTVVNLAVRSISAKLALASTDVRAASLSVEDETRLVAVHDSIRGDVESLLREWDESRAILRRALDLRFERGKQGGAGAGARKSEDVAETASTVFDSSEEVVTPEDSKVGSPVIEGATRNEGQEEEEEEDLLATLLLESTSAEHLPARGGSEQVFEYESGVEAAGGQQQRATTTKMTREERIQMMKAKRAMMEDEDRERREQGIVELSRDGLVDELKDVIGELRRRQGRRSD
jgi:hypothetical protein